MAWAVLHFQCAIAELEQLAVVKRPRDIRLRAPSPEAPRYRAQRHHDILWDAVAEHERRGETVIGLDVLPEVLHEPDDHVDRGDVGAGAVGDYLDQAEVVDVLVGEDHQVEIGDRVPQIRELVLELVERVAGIRTGVDQR